jgi:hypothetical protein
MDIQVSSEEFKSFLKKCHSGGLVKDLVIQADTDKGIFSRFATKEKSFYAEVYLKNVKVNAEGTIKVPHVKKLMDVISRADSKIIRILSTEDTFCVTDGAGVGKMKTDMLQIGDAEIVESYHDIQNLGKMFDTTSLEYTVAGIKYENGCKISSGMLSEVLKDAKAFGFEVYTFMTKDVKGKLQLRCFIVNQHTTEKLQRVVADNDFLGDISAVKESTVGKGFKEILEGVLGEEKELVEIYFHENSWLITDRETFYFNLHTLDEN